MICPYDGTQLHELNQLGSGEAGEEYYDTMEIKECPKCLKRFIEVYMTAEIGGRSEMENSAYYLTDFSEKLSTLIRNVDNLINRLINGKN